MCWQSHDPCQSCREISCLFIQEHSKAHNCRTSIQCLSSHGVFLVCLCQHVTILLYAYQSHWIRNISCSRTSSWTNYICKGPAYCGIMSTRKGSDIFCCVNCHNSNINTYQLSLNSVFNDWWSLLDLVTCGFHNTVCMYVCMCLCVCRGALCMFVCKPEVDIGYLP